MLYGLTEEDLKNIDKNGVKELIKINEERLKVWSIPNYEKKQIEEEIRQLKKLLQRYRQAVRHSTLTAAVPGSNPGSAVMALSQNKKEVQG